MTKLRQFDPPDSLDYLQALSLATRAFSVVASHGEFEEKLGQTRITDVSDLPVFRQMSSVDPLPVGFSLRAYQFRDGKKGRGVLEATFHRNELVNVRLQLFFEGWFAKSKARRYLMEQLVPSIEVMFGPAQEVTQHHAAFRNPGLVVLARYVPGTSSISTYLMHEEYA